MRRLGFFKINLTWLLSLFVAFSLAGESWALSRASLPLADVPTTTNNGGSLILAQMRGKPVAKPKRSIRQSAVPRTNQPRLRIVRPPTPQTSRPQLNMPRVTLPTPGRRSSLIAGRFGSRPTLLSGGVRTPRMLAGRRHTANVGSRIRLTVSSTKARVGLRLATSSPRIAPAGLSRRRTDLSRVAVTGITSRPQAVKGYIRAGVRSEFNRVSSVAGSHQFRHGHGSSASFERIRTIGVASNTVVAITNRQTVGGIGPRAIEVALRNQSTRGAVQALGKRIRNISHLSNSNANGFSARLSISRRIISNGWSSTKRPDSTLGTIPHTKAMVAMKHSRGGVVTITDIKRGSLPRGTAGLLVSKVMRESGIRKPKTIVFQNVIEKNTVRTYNAGKSPENTVLASTAKLAIREMGLKPGKVSWEKDRIGKLNLRVEVQ